VYLFTSTRKNMRHLASQFQLACLPLRHRVEELFEFVKGAFGAVRTTHRAAYALPIHLLGCLLAYSLYKSLIAYALSPGIALSRRLGCQSQLPLLGFVTSTQPTVLRAKEAKDNG
jgi:hypothetical protein